MGLKKFKQSSENGGAGKISRKEARKNSKKLKKMQAIAFAQKKPIENIMRKEMGLTKADKKRNKRKRNREEKKRKRFEEKKRKKEEENDSDDDEEIDSDDYEDEKPASSRKRDNVPEVSVHRGKRKYGDESEDSDEDLTYEQYLKEVEETKRKRLMNMEGVEEDDAAIRKYGVLLKLSENKKDKEGKLKVSNSMKNDGLDLLLDFCDSEKRKELLSKEKTGMVDDEDEEENEENDLSDEEESEDKQDYEEDEINLSENDDGDETMIDEMISDEEEFDENSDENEDETEQTEKEEEIEDIYGRKIKKSTGELIKFDPAAAKKKLEELDKSNESSISLEQKAKVDRMVTGIINRLSDSTLVKSQQGIAELWSAHSKNDVKSALCKVLSRVLSSPFRIQDSLLITYGAFISMCHTMISNEISAHFVEIFLCEMVKRAENENEDAFADDKSIENQVVFVAMLLNFRIIQPSVFIELIDKFENNLTLANLQSIYLLVAYGYKSMKKTSWQLVVEKIDKITTEFKMKPISSLPRAAFLVEQVEQLKKQSPKSVDYSIIEHQVKVLHGLSKKNKSTSDTNELGMSLNDLLHAEERGRWWVVGSAFRLPEQGGYGLLTLANQKNKSGTYPPEIVAMAQKAGMNSEIRRNIFCCVATAEDEDESFEKLLKLSLKGEKERELVHVLIVMMLKEKTFNPFYAALLQRFCEFNKRFVITLQFALWDRLRECDSLKQNQRNSIAQLLKTLIANEVLPITVLKSVEWATLSSFLTNLLKKLFVGLSNSPESVMKRIFEPLTNPQKKGKYELFSEGMRVFWNIHLKDLEVYKNVDKWILESSYD